MPIFLDTANTDRMRQAVKPGMQAGATDVSSFVGRLDDIGQDGIELVKDIADVFTHYELSTKVVAASIRHPLHCVAGAKAGAHIACYR